MPGFISLFCQQTTVFLPHLFSISARNLPNFSRPIVTLQILKPQSQILRNPKRFAAFSGNNGDQLGRNLKEEGENNGGGGDDLKKERGPVFNFKWAELLLDPDPDNLLAVALTGLLAWASVQVLWQLFFISLAILVAALKYSFIAALLLFILITLL